MNASAAQLFSFIQPGTPAHGMVLPIYRVDLPVSVNLTLIFPPQLTYLAIPLQIRQEICFQGNSKSS